MKKSVLFNSVAFLLVSFLLGLAVMVQADVTGRINFQGRLSDDSGFPVPDDDYQMTFSIYALATGGGAIWNETQNVATTDGIYSVVLGLINEIDPDDMTGDRYLGVKVESDLEMTPRQLLTAVPFTLKAADSEALSGQSATDFATAVHGHSFSEITGTVTDGQVPDTITINNADNLDGKDSTEFANAIHGHGFWEITGILSDGQLPSIVTRDYEVMAHVLSSDGPGSGLNADRLDGLSSEEFLSTTSDYGRIGVATSLYEGKNTLESKYVNLTGDLMTGPLWINTIGIGLYSSATTTTGTAHGGYFKGENYSSGGISYGLYTEATGTNGPRYGLYADVTTSGADSYRNYGVYSETATTNGNAFGFYGNVDSTHSFGAYGAFLDVDKNSFATGDLYGIRTEVNHAGGSGSSFGLSVVTYASDTGPCFSGHFTAYSNSGDTGDLYGVRSFIDNDTSGNKYAGYFYKNGGGDYAGYFAGNVHVAGTLSATSKPFVQPHKFDPTKEIAYVSMEGPENAVFIRGTATLEEGVAYIEMPEYWTQVAADEGITVNLTPEGVWAPLYVASKSKEKILVQVAEGGPLDATFSYTVMALRDGFQDHEPIQENSHFTADGASAWQFENQFAEDTPDNIAIREMLMANGIMNADGSLNTQTAQGLGWKVKPNEEDNHYRQAHDMEPLDAPQKEKDKPRPSRAMEKEELHDQQQEPLG